MKIYQIAPEPQSLMMCYIILTDNNKVVVIDGGICGFGAGNESYIQAAVRAVLGIGQNDYFEIDGWFLTHVHDDHFYELAKLLKNYSSDSNFRIKNLYFDFPSEKDKWKNDYSHNELEILKQGFDNYASVLRLNGFSYESVNGSIINHDSVEKGLTIQIDNCEFDILQTWDDDDAIVNSTSIIFRMRYKKHSVLFLGDAYRDSGDRLLCRYSGEELKSEYIQLAHHGQNGVSEEFYHAVYTDDSIRLWPSPEWVWGVYKHPSIKCDVTRSWFGLPEDPKEYFAGGFDRTGRDIVAGYYERYPANPVSVSDWKAVLEYQLAADLK